MGVASALAYGSLRSDAHTHLTPRSLRAHCRDLRALMHGPVVKEADEWAYRVETGKHDGPPVRLGMTAKAARKAFTREYRRCLDDLT